MRKIYYVIALISAILFGAASPLSKPLLTTFSSFQLAGLLYIGAALGVLVLLVREKKILLPQQIKGKSRRYLIGAILFGGILGPVFLLFGLKLASAGSISLWLTLETVATAFLGHLIFKDYLTKWGWVATVLTIFAAVLLAWGEGAAGVKAGLFVFLATICWGFDNHFTALIDGITPAMSTFYKGLVAGSFNLLIGTLLMGWNAELGMIAGGLTIGIFSYGLSIVLYITAAQQLGATRSQMFFSSAPLFGILLASVFLKETISVFQITAAFMLALAFVILFIEQHSHEHLHESLYHAHLHRHDDGHHDHEHADRANQLLHEHWHSHKRLKHSHIHLPDLHHRHEH